MSPTRIDFGGNPGRSPIQDRQAGFAGGLNTVSDPSAVAANQCVNLTNMRLTNYGAASRRLGTKRTTASALTSAGTNYIIMGGAYWPAQDKFVYSDALGNIYWDTGFTFQLMVGAATLASSTGFCPFVAGSQVATMYVADGSNLYKFDGTTWSTVWSGTAAINRMVVYNQRLWGWKWLLPNGPQTSNALYYSNLSTASGSIGGDSLAVGASGGGQINIQTFGMSQIMACQVVGSSLMILHAKGVSRLTGFGQSDITVLPQAVSDTDSIVGPSAICEADGVAWFVTARGLCQMTESAITLVGTPTTPDPLPAVISTLATSFGSNFFATIQCLYNRPRQEVWVMIPFIGVYVYHTVLGAWAGPWNGPFAGAGNTYPVMYTGRTTDEVYVSDAINGYMCQADGSSFAIQKDLVHSDGSGGSAFTATIQCHRMFGGSAYVAGTETTLPVGASTAKSWRNVNVLATLTNGGTAPTVTTASVYGGSNTVTMAAPTAGEQTYYNAAGGAGPYVDVTITDTGTTASQYASVDVEGFALGRR